MRFDIIIDSNSGLGLATDLERPRNISLIEEYLYRYLTRPNVISDNL